LLERWFTVASVRWAPTTARNVRSIIDRQLVPKSGDVLVRELTAVMIDEFYAGLRRNGRIDAAPLSVGAVRRVHAVLHAALAQAMRWEWIWSNPAASACPPRSEPVEVRPPTPGEVAVLLDRVLDRDPSFHLFLVLAATTGARRGQLLGLRWSDVDLAGGSLLFQRALVEGMTGPVLAPSKNHRCHRAFLDDTTAALLRDYHQGLCVPRQARDRFVFAVDLDGLRPWLPNWTTKRFIELHSDAGLDHFRLHDLRHFMATEMLNAGVAIPIVAERLAHARASTTLNHYAHAVPGGDRAAAELLSTIIRSS
jgi:integrase